MDLNNLFNKEKLPYPLEKEELYKLLQESQNGSKEAKDILVVHNLRLVLHEVTNRFSSVSYDKQDLVSVGIIGLINAINSFDLNKGYEFSTYASRCVDNEILMFLRKIKKDINLESFEETIFTDNNGDTVKLEDTISDDINLFDDYEKKEFYKSIRELVMQLPERDKKIMMMHFGFSNNKTYSQKEIAEILNMSRSNVSTIVNKNLNILREQLLFFNVSDFYDIGNNTEPKKRKRKTRPKRKSTIYDSFKDYTKEQVNKMLTKLTEEERDLITLRFGDDLDNPTYCNLEGKTFDKFYGNLRPKMKRLLSDPNYKPRVKKEKKEKQRIITPKEGKSTTTISKEDILKLLEILKSPLFTEIMNDITIKESVIISLKLGFVDGKCFSTSSIAKFLEVDEKEVIEITRSILLKYRDKLNNIMDNLINYTTDTKKRTN